MAAASKRKAVATRPAKVTVENGRLQTPMSDEELRNTHIAALKGAVDEVTKHLHRLHGMGYFANLSWSANPDGTYKSRVEVRLAIVE